MKKIMWLVVFCLGIWATGMGCPAPPQDEKVADSGTKDTDVKDEGTKDEGTQDEDTKDEGTKDEGDKPEPNKPEPTPEPAPEPNKPEPAPEPNKPEPTPEPTQEPASEPSQPEPTPEPVADASGPETKPEVGPEPSGPEPSGPEPSGPESSGPESKPDSGPITKPDPQAATQITSVRSGTVGNIAQVAVTYTKAKAGSDPEGFMVQATPNGPAVFVVATLATAKVKVGDIISFKADTINTKAQGRVQVDKYSALVIHSSGFDVKPWVQDITSATDAVSSLGDYESELIKLKATIKGDFTGAGSGFVAAVIETVGVTGSTAFKLRVPAPTGKPSLATTLGLTKGCKVEVTHGFMWRFGSTAQPSVDDKSQIKVTSCPKAAVASANAASATSVIVTFTGAIDATSLTANGGQFSFDNGLLASAAKVLAPNKIEVTTGTQDGSKTYKVTVDVSLQDLFSQGIDAAKNTASFKGFNQGAKVVINEFNTNIPSCDLVELRVVTGGSMAGFKLYNRNSDLKVSFAGLTVKKNDFIVVHLGGSSSKCNPGSAKNETTSVNQYPKAQYAANFDTAYDIYSSSSSGLTNSTTVITLTDAAGKIVDAVFHAVSTSYNVSGTTVGQANVVNKAKQWTDASGQSPVGGYTTSNYKTYCVVGALDKTVAGKSIQRNGNTDTNSKADWAAPAASTWGKKNVGQTDF